MPVVISVAISDVANQKRKRPCPSFSGDHHPQQVVGSSSKNAHGERLSFGSVVNLAFPPTRQSWRQTGVMAAS